MKISKFTKTPMGWARLDAEKGYLTGFEFVEKRKIENQRHRILDWAIQELEAYFEEGSSGFTVPLKLEGSSFEKSVWNVLQEIPYGATMSYQEIANLVGCPGGARAVGNAVGKNPLPIFVPCHRVVGAHGALGGFSCGIDKKIFLLNLESLPVEPVSFESSFLSSCI